MTTSRALEHATIRSTRLCTRLCTWLAVDLLEAADSCGKSATGVVVWSERRDLCYRLPLKLLLFFRLRFVSVYLSCVPETSGESCVLHHISE
jgi:hypothetical protein